MGNTLILMSMTREKLGIYYSNIKDILYFDALTGLQLINFQGGGQHLTAYECTRDWFGIDLLFVVLWERN